MKTYPLLLLAFIAFTSAFTACSDEKEHILTEENLPELAQNFLRTYLSEYEIKEIVDLNPEDDNTEKYKITFTDNFVVGFNRLGYLRYAESETVLPEGILDILSQEERNEIRWEDIQAIKAIRNDDTKFTRKLHLLNGDYLVYYYDEDNILRLAKDLTDKPKDTLPANLLQFISAYYKDFNTDYILYGHTTERTIFRVSLSRYSGRMNIGLPLPSSPVIIKFDSVGDWFSVTGKEQAIPEELYNSFPEEVKKMKGEVYPELTIYGVTRTHDYYYLDLSENTTLTVLLNDGEPYPFRYNVLQGFMQEHFNPKDAHISTTITKISSTPHLFRCRVTIENGYNLEIEADLDGIWQKIQVINSSMPVSVIETLPSDIKTTLEETGLLNEVSEIIKEVDGGYVFFAKNMLLKFDKQGVLFEERPINQE